jgi:hypothetical protein
VPATFAAGGGSCRNTANAPFKGSEDTQVAELERKLGNTITLQEHMKSIAGKGGEARVKKLSAARKSAIAKKGGRVGGKARAAALTAEKRAEIARKAAAARWGKKD